MKNFIKIQILIFLILIFTAYGCFLDSGDDETGTPTTLTGNGILTVNATYTGTAKTDGSGRIYVYLYTSLRTAQDTPVYQGSTDSEADNTEKAISVKGIAAGDYYVLVLYDYKLHNQNIAGNTDRYALYESVNNTTAYLYEAAQVAVADNNPVELDLSFGDDYQIGSDGRYMSSLVVTAAYTGTVTAGYQIYAYLYNSLSTTAQSPVYQAGTSDLTGGTGVITLENILAIKDNECYRLVIFYDADNNAAASAGDPYCIYDSKQYIGDAAEVILSSSSAGSISQTFSNSNKFGTDGAYLVSDAVGSLNVQVKYTGTPFTDGTGFIYMQLYTSAEGLGTAPATTKTYQADSNGITPDGGGYYTITISDVPVGDYYVLIFYDYKLQTTPGRPGKDDRYILYNNTPYTDEADLASIVYGNTTPLGTVSFGDDYKLLGGTNSYMSH